jgi:hypothetical protein
MCSDSNAAGSHASTEAEAAIQSRADVADFFSTLQLVRQSCGRHAVRLGQSEEYLAAILDWLRIEVHGPLLADRVHVPNELVVEALGKAGTLAAIARIRFVQENLSRLEAQFKAHAKSKELRRT